MRSLRALSLGVVFVVAGCAESTLDAAARAKIVDRVDVIDTMSACFAGSDNSDVLKLHGNDLVSAKKRVPEAKAEHLIDLLLASRDATVDPLAELGITPQAVDAHRDHLRALFKKTFNSAFPSEAAVLDSQLSYEHVAAAIRSNLEWMERSTTQVDLRVRLHRGDQTIEVESQAQLPFMLPWKVTASGRSWFSYSVEISRALAEFVADHGTAGDLLSRGDAYWRDGVWEDFMVFFELGSATQELVAQRMYQGLAGWDEARKTWRVVKAQTGNINFEDPSLVLALQRLGPSTADEPINAVWWWDTLQNDQPAFDWRELSDVLVRANRAIAAHHWLSEWVTAGPNRDLELQLVGKRGYTEAQDLPIFLLPAWKDAAMRGEPEFELLLRRDGGTWSGTLYFNSQDERVIVTSMSPMPNSPHWLDEQSLNFHAQGSRDYLVVSPDGTHEQRRAR